MKKADPIERYDVLKKQLLDYAYRYYVLEEPSVSDAIYDGLMRELKEIEAAYPELIAPDSPTQRIVGEPLEQFEKIPHSVRMLSLNDVFDQADVEAWAKRMEKLVPNHTPEYFADIKKDGLGCALVYEDGLLKHALTRGDGTIGEDVTMNVKTIPNVPLRLKQTKGYEQLLNGRTEIRGEIVMLKKDFAALNAKREAAGLPVFANPRNLAAGTIRQLDPKLVAERPLRFLPYSLMRDDPAAVSTVSGAYKAIEALGFTPNKESTVLHSLEAVMAYAKKWETARHDLPYNTDGLVVQVNDRALYNQLGFVGKNPRGAIAFKYPAEQATTVLKDIVISIGRTGAATPVAVFNPVVVAGTTVQHASLHNADEIARKDVRVGDSVVIFKAGDIIPQVEKVLVELRPKGTKSFDMEAELKRQYPELTFVRPEGEAVYRVKGATGPILLKRALEHYASRGALDIDTLGEKNVAALVDAKLVHDLADIYSLSKDKVLGLERFADLSATNLVEAIAAKKRPPLAKFVYALGIRHVGTQTAIDLAEHFGSLHKLAHATLEQLQEVEGVGDVVAESILGWFADEDNLRLLDKFDSLGVKPVHESHADGPLAGKSFVITGTLEAMGRDEAGEKIRALGGTFQSSVGKDTTYLVVGANVGASKLTKAAKLGVEQIDEAKLFTLLDKK